MRSQSKMRRATLLLVAAAAVVALAGGRLLAFPEPSAVPVSWQLDIKYEHPKVIAVRTPGESAPRIYWYVTYTVTNNSGEDQNFVPLVTLLTDAGDLLRAQRGIPPVVFEHLKSELRNPLLTSPNDVVGKILQGPDHAIDGVAIWAMPEHDVNNISIFFEGLSGETHVVKDPVSNEDKLLRKTMHLEYETPGSVERQPKKPWLFRYQKWVIR